VTTPGGGSPHRRRRAVGSAKIGRPIGAVYQSSWAQAGEYASAADMGAIPIVSIVEIPQGGLGLDQSGLLDLGGPIPALEEPAEKPSVESAGVARNSAVMALGTIASRITGMARTIVTAYAIGSAAVSSAYAYANNLPNQVYELLLGGVLAGVVVPLLVKAQKTDADQGEAFIQRLLTMTVALFAAITAVAVAAAPLLTTLVAGPSFRAQPGNSALTTTFAYLILPEILFYAVAAVFGAVLNSRGRFAAPAWVPVLNNLVVIVTAAVFFVMHGSGKLDVSTLTGAEVLVLGVGTTLGIVVQSLALWIPMHRLGFRWKWRWDWRATGLAEAGNVAGWLILYVALSQVGLTAVLNATGSAPGGVGSAVYNYAYVLFTLPHGLVAVSVITALLPRMSRAAVDGRPRAIAHDLSLGTRLSATLLVPASGVLLALGPAIGVLIYAHGNTNVEQGVLIGEVAAVAGIGLVPFAISQIQTFVFYSMREPRTAALINIPVVLMRIVGAVLVAILIPGRAPGFVLQALMIVNTGSYVLAMVLGAFFLRRRLGRLHLVRTISTLVRVTLATIPAVLVAYLIQTQLSRLLGQSLVADIVALGAGLTVGGGVYLGLALLLRVREIREVFDQIRRRVARG
jgi:putative peptidoglycan lipid II flippase